MTGTQQIKTYHWILFAICFLGTAFAGVISTLMSVYLPVAVKDLLGDKGADELNNISAYINSVFIFGGAFGGFISGIISDKGRKKNCSYFFNCMLRPVYDSYRIYADMVGCCDLSLF
jgi:MFS family permease